VYLDTSIIENSLQVGGLALELVLGLVILILIVLLIRERYRGERVEKNSMRPVQPQKPTAILGIDQALATLFYRELRKAIEQGKVRPALYSDECPGGTIAYDFARQDWVCIEKDGATHPLGQPPAGEQLELEDYTGVGEE